MRLIVFLSIITESADPLFFCEAKELTRSARERLFGGFFAAKRFSPGEAMRSSFRASEKMKFAAWARTTFGRIFRSGAIFSHRSLFCVAKKLKACGVLAAAFRRIFRGCVVFFQRSRMSIPRDGKNRAAAKKTRKASASPYRQYAATN